jgi:putative addiction module killer protein
MYKIIQTDEFKAWRQGLNDQRLKDQINIRLLRAEMGNLGDHHFLREGVSEMREKFGAGYRFYYAKVPDAILVLLWGGSKKGQSRDIELAIELFKKWEANYHGQN